MDHGYDTLEICKQVNALGVQDDDKLSLTMVKMMMKMMVKMMVKTMVMMMMAVRGSAGLSLTDSKEGFLE